MDIFSILRYFNPKTLQQRVDNIVYLNYENAVTIDTNTYIDIARDIVLLQGRKFELLKKYSRAKLYLAM